ncbi:MAG: plastocyanin/azurin family copper-binding protein [Candidatus Thalassarchaeaceae archaeon]|nr:plastocyanin/azurin family copper-binding protein [Candidatus Thalassarchaeaceae archaeon]
MKRVLLACIFLLLFSFSTIISNPVLSEGNNKVISSEEVIITVDSTNLRFSPSEISIMEGDTVRFFWQGQLLAHNAVERNGLFDSGEPERDVDYSFKFEIGMNGTYEFVCEPHESANMIGEIIVNPLVQEVVEEEEKEKSVPGFSIILLLSSLAAAGILDRRKMDGNL